MVSTLHGCEYQTQVQITLRHIKPGDKLAKDMHDIRNAISIHYILVTGPSLIICLDQTS
jgi:hypothetical protein